MCCAEMRANAGCIPKDTYEREKSAALRVLSLKYKTSADPRKMMANLYQKGFDLDAARAAVEAYAAEAEMDSDFS